MRDAVLVVSFGGPEGPDDVVPFLRNVTAGRGIPEERLAEVGRHYELFGGVSPINGLNRTLVAAVRDCLAAAGPALPVYWGNRHWQPFLEATIRQMAEDGIERAFAFVTSAYSSYAGCRQYLEAIAAARHAVGVDAPVVEKLRVYFDHPGFIEPITESAGRALTALPGARVVFTAHSIPVAMAETSRYVSQLAASCRLVADRLGVHEWDLAYQSRSGPPFVPWLEPDVSDHLRALSRADGGGRAGVVLVPIGFVSDHMEVVYDLDVVARATADELHIPLRRSDTPGNDPRFVSMVRELVLERLGGQNGQGDLGEAIRARCLSGLGPWPDRCAPGCCPPPAARPAAPVDEPN